MDSNDDRFQAVLPEQMAFFSWDLEQDRLYGDDALAGLFGIDPLTLAEGLPILKLIERVTDDDRPRVAKAIHTAITMGSPYQEAYRVDHDNGGSLEVIAAGRCFRRPDGSPSLYAGMVVEAKEASIPLDTDPLIIHCQAALDLAKSRGNDLATRYLSSALRVIGASESEG